jgi:hypothetical protein
VASSSPEECSWDPDNKLAGEIDPKAKLSSKPPMDTFCGQIFLQVQLVNANPIRRDDNDVAISG